MLHLEPEIKEEKLPAEADVVIVGAGPIGLALAWGLKKLDPSLKVIVLEKYEEYQRKHTLMMQHQRLKELMDATGTQDDPDLCELLAQLKKDPYIRTSELEQKFKNLAQKNNVHIVIQNVREQTIHKQLFEFKERPCLIIGADGTHSVVNKSLFPEGNQVKHEFDYVLQLRFDIQGDHPAPSANRISFFQNMAYRGVIANEYVGRFAEGKTPVTMQMMISKEEFNALKDRATSKEPINFTADNIPVLPDRLSQFVNHYLASVIKNCEKDKLIINTESKIRISVNEAPATHAREVIYLSKDCNRVMMLGEDEKVVKKDENTIFLRKNENGLTKYWFEDGQQNEQVLEQKSSGELSELFKQTKMIEKENNKQFSKVISLCDDRPSEKIPKILVGDAGLGLSYFKGLNAGLEAAAKLFSLLSPVLKKDLKKNKKSLINALGLYQNWFLKEFAPRKVKEVSQYSTWRIRSAQRLMESLRFMKMSSAVEYTHDPKYLIADYLNQQAEQLGERIDWDPYPHRKYDPEIKLWELGYVPISYSTKKTVKLFTSYFTPYKAFKFQLRESFQQPLVGIVHTTIGLGKFLMGTISLSPNMIGDGFINFSRGVLELATFPLAWVLKPITKGISTAIFGFQKIEDNTGIKKLVKDGRALLNGDEKESKFSIEKIIRIKHICFDLNRKFNKSIKKGQETDIDEMKEIEQLNKVRESTNKEQFESYFCLFSNKSLQLDQSTISLQPTEYDRSKSL